MKVGQRAMRSEDAPPGFWRSPQDVVAVDGVEISSFVPTRFFQTLDATPKAWGRLSWRVQVNKIVDGRAGLPAFRTFYPGVEWNLRSGDGRWFLTAWFKWEGPGPPDCDLPLPRPARIEGDTALFPIARLPASPGEAEEVRTLVLKCRVDARDRRLVAQALRTARATEVAASGLIVLDDVIDSRGLY
jgi:hypothetical protein